MRSSRSSSVSAVAAGQPTIKIVPTVVQAPTSKAQRDRAAFRIFVPFLEGAAINDMPDIRIQVLSSWRRLEVQLVAVFVAAMPADGSAGDCWVDPNPGCAVAYRYSASKPAGLHDLGQQLVVVLDRHRRIEIAERNALPGPRDQRSRWHKGGAPVRPAHCGHHPRRPRIRPVRSPCPLSHNRSFIGHGPQVRALFGGVAIRASQKMLEQ